MRVSEVMSRDVQVANPNQTIREAAQTMAEIDAGGLPVGENDRLVGMLTDRDIAIRGIAEGRGPDTAVSEVMTPEVRYCFDDQDTDEVAANMGDEQIRRIPVVNRDKRLVGILSLGDLVRADGPMPAGDALRDISRPGGRHSQSAHS